MRSCTYILPPLVNSQSHRSKGNVKLLNCSQQFFKSHHDKKEQICKGKYVLNAFWLEGIRYFWIFFIVKKLNSCMIDLFCQNELNVVAIKSGMLYNFTKNLKHENVSILKSICNTLHQRKDKVETSSDGDYLTM